MRSAVILHPSDANNTQTRKRKMSEAKATKCAERMSRETGKACKVIHLGDNRYQAVIIGSTKHRQSLGHN